jgi:hypothetical protein
MKPRAGELAGPVLVAKYDIPSAPFVASGRGWRTDPGPRILAFMSIHGLQ